MIIFNSILTFLTLLFILKESSSKKLTIQRIGGDLTVERITVKISGGKRANLKELFSFFLILNFLKVEIWFVSFMLSLAIFSWK